MIYTSSYLKPTTHHGLLIGISNSLPKGWSIASTGKPRKSNQIDLVQPLFYPSWDMIKRWKDSGKNDASWETYTNQFWKLMQQRKPEILAWLKTLSPMRDYTLLSFESDDERCHRRYVGQIIYQQLPKQWGGEGILFSKPARYDQLVEWFSYYKESLETADPFQISSYETVKNPAVLHKYLCNRIQYIQHCQEKRIPYQWDRDDLIKILDKLQRYGPKIQKASATR